LQSFLCIFKFEPLPNSDFEFSRHIVSYPEWSAKINVGLNHSIQTIEVNAGTEIEKRAKTLYHNIEDIDRYARDLFTSAYIQFTTNPCANDKILDSKVDSIFELVNELSQDGIIHTWMDRRPKSIKHMLCS
jgi:hypothetical protein